MLQDTIKEKNRRLGRKVSMHMKEQGLMLKEFLEFLKMTITQ